MINYAHNLVFIHAETIKPLAAWGKRFGMSENENQEGRKLRD